MPRASSAGRRLGGVRLGQRQEGGLHRGGDALRGVGKDLAVPDPGQGRQLAGGFHRGRAEGGREADARVAGEDPDQFLAGIAGGAHEGDVDSLVRLAAHRPDYPGARLSQIPVRPASPSSDAGPLSAHIYAERTIFIHRPICRPSTGKSLTWQGLSAILASAAGLMTAMYSDASVPHESPTASGHPRARPARADRQPGDAPPAPPRAGHRRHAGDTVARYQGNRAGEAVGRRLPGARAASRGPPPPPKPPSAAPPASSCAPTKSSRT